MTKRSQQLPIIIITITITINMTILLVKLILQLSRAKLYPRLSTHKNQSLNLRRHDNTFNRNIQNSSLNHIPYHYSSSLLHHSHSVALYASNVTSLHSLVYNQFNYNCTPSPPSTSRSSSITLFFLSAKPADLH